MIFTKNGMFIAHRIKAAALFTFNCKLAKKTDHYNILYQTLCKQSHICTHSQLIVATLEMSFCGWLY